MEKRGVFTKILAIAGTAFVWFPILAPLSISLVVFIKARRFQIDYLMPAELFLAVLAGGCLLLWAALRAGAHWGFIGYGLVIATGMLVGGQALADVTGLASGETEPVGFWWGLLIASLAVYILAVILTGVGGLLLLRNLFKIPMKNQD